MPSIIKNPPPPVISCGFFFSILVWCYFCIWAILHDRFLITGEPELQVLKFRWNWSFSFISKYGILSYHGYFLGENNCNAMFIIINHGKQTLNVHWLWYILENTAKILKKDDGATSYGDKLNVAFQKPSKINSNVATAISRGQWHNFLM